MLRAPSVLADGCINTQVKEANVNYMAPYMVMFCNADDTGNNSGVAIMNRESRARQCHLASFIQLTRCRCPLCLPRHITHLPRNDYLSEKERR